jgi:hypothetical protein
LVSGAQFRVRWEGYDDVVRAIPAGEDGGALRRGPSPRVAGPNWCRACHVGEIVELLNVANVHADPELGFTSRIVTARAVALEMVGRVVSGSALTLPPMLIAAFIVAGLLEVVGVGLVLRDLGKQRNAALQLIATPASEPVELDESNVRQFVGSLTARRQQLQQQSDIEKAGAAVELVRAVLVDLLRPQPFEWRRTHDWRPFGPVLVALGIAIGTVAEICAM